MRRGNLRHQTSPASTVRAMIAAVVIVFLLMIGFVFNTRSQRSQRTHMKPSLSLDNGEDASADAVSTDITSQSSVSASATSASSGEEKQGEVKLAYVLTEGLHGSTWTYVGWRLKYFHFQAM